MNNFPPVFDKNKFTDDTKIGSDKPMYCKNTREFNKERGEKASANS